MFFNVGKYKEIFFRLRHFFVVHVDEAVVHPEADKLLSCNSFRLSFLIRVVGKHEIDPAGVDVYCFSKVFHRHSRTFNMPAGASFAESGLPTHIAVIRCVEFPKREILRLLFIVFVVSHARFRALGFCQLCEGAIALCLGNTKIDAIIRSVGNILCKERLNECDHFRNMLSSPRGYSRAEDIHFLYVAEKDLLVFSCEFIQGNTGCLAPADTFFINIGDVHYLLNIEAKCGKYSTEYVGKNKSPDVSDMDVVVDRRAAVIHCHLRRVKGGERLNLPRERIVEPESHTMQYIVSSSQFPVNTKCHVSYWQLATGN